MKKGRTKTGEIWLLGDSEIGILFFHGWSSPPDELLPIAKELNSLGYTFYAPVLSGHGTKPEDLAGIKWRDWERDAKKALAKMKRLAQRIFVAGVSMGGNLALILESDRNVEGLILLGTPAKFRFHRLGKTALYFLGLVKDQRKKYYPPSVREKMKERNAYRSYPIASAKEVARLVDHTRKNLSKIKKPILVIQSTADHMVAKKTPDIIYKNVKSEIKEIFWLKDAYHVFVDDRRVWKKMEEFIGKISNY